MPVYYLNLRDGDVLIEDPEGSELPDLQAAHEEAVVAAREILSEKLKSGLILDGQSIEICDGSGAILEVVSFRSVFTVSP